MLSWSENNTQLTSLSCCTRSRLERSLTVSIIQVWTVSQSPGDQSPLFCGSTFCSADRARINCVSITALTRTAERSVCFGIYFFLVTKIRVKIKSLLRLVITGSLWCTKLSTLSAVMPDRLFKNTWFCSSLLWISTCVCSQFNLGRMGFSHRLRFSLLVLSLKMYWIIIWDSNAVQKNWWH